MRQLVKNFGFHYNVRYLFYNVSVTHFNYRYHVALFLFCHMGATKVVEIESQTIKGLEPLLLTNMRCYLLEYKRI